MVLVNCANCSKEFETSSFKLENGRGKYCTKACLNSASWLIKGRPMAQKHKCTAPNCENDQHTVGYCRKHYSQFYRHGRILPTTKRDPRPAVIEGDVAKIPLGVGAKDGYAIVDKEFAYLDRLKWRGNEHGYAVTSRGMGIHRMILTAEIIDHIDGNPLNNRKSNLRVATTSQNGCNRDKMSNNKSGYKGVCWHKKSQRFRATICINQNRMHIGQFRTALEAARAYNERAKELHGEFARLNNGL